MLEQCRRVGRTPSEVAGISCRYCAWAFDAALASREMLAEAARAEEAEREAEREAIAMRHRARIEEAYRRRE